MDVLGYTTLQKSYTSTFYYGFGYEQNVGEKISLGLTYRKGYSIDPDYSTLVNSYSFVGYENGVGYNVSFDILNISNFELKKGEKVFLYFLRCLQAGSDSCTHIIRSRIKK